uniref:Uncharacterized protein n=1 Tax=Arundo donax TaxID=35708 RepID=A0A0A9ATT5_ARUDO
MTFIFTYFRWRMAYLLIVWMRHLYPWVWKIPCLCACIFWDG